MSRWPPVRSRPAFRRAMRHTLKHLGGAPSWQARRMRMARTRTRRLIVPGITRRAGFFGINRSGELKFHDIDINDSAIAAGVTVAEDSCVTIIQGVTESQRIGRKCTIRSINWRFNISLVSQVDSADPPKGDVVRILLYQDKQTNGAAATSTQILESADFQSFNNLANKSRFRTLMDRTYTIDHTLAQTDGTNTGGYAEVNITDTLFKRVNIPIEYDSTTGAITEVRSNNIGVLTISKNGTATFESKMRLRFSDN